MECLVGRSPPWQTHPRHPPSSRPLPRATRIQIAPRVEAAITLVESKEHRMTGGTLGTPDVLLERRAPRDGDTQQSALLTT